MKHSCAQGASRPMGSSLFVLISTLILLSACAEQAEEGPISSREQALTPEEERILAFDEVTDWEIWSGSGTIQNSTLHSEGTHSVAVSNIGYAGIRNATAITKDEHPAPTVVGYDVWIPTDQPNPTWHGDTQLMISAPSAGIYEQYLGYRSFNPLPKGQFVRVEFPLPDWIRQALDNTNYSDLRFVVAINAPVGSSTHYVDRFILGPDPGGQTCVPTDDQNPCTADECDPVSGQTTHVPLAPDAMCSDGNACNGMELCDGAGTCQPGEAPTVDDQNPCTTDSCDPETGVSHSPVAAGTSCDDGDACNGDELCDAVGVCQVGTPPALSDDNPCTVDSCDPGNGVVHEPAPAGSSCADGDVCNGAELCDGAGTCQPGEAPAVDDQNPCTTDSCDPETGVSHSPVATGTSCDDGDLCNGASLCDGAGACVAGVPPALDDGNPCTDDSCDPAVGVIHANTAPGTSCGDADVCNGIEACDGAGSCQVGAPPEVDDGNPCTSDACDPTEGVTHLPAAAGTSCADADACNGAEQCDGSGSCQPGIPVDTDDGNPCTLGSCDSATGAVTQDPVPPGVDCGNGDLCDGSEYCDGAASCEPGNAPQLDDGNLCTVDSCDPLFGVDHSPAPAGTSCDDGDVCDGDEMCDGAGSCAPGTPLDPDDGDACTVDSCDPALGAQHTPAPAGTSCSNQNACDGEELCDGAGTCTSGTPLDPDDGNPCTADSCDAAGGVSHSPAPAGTSCDDGDLCNGADTCDGAGSCQHEGASAADDGNPCTVDTCNPDGTFSHELAPEGTSCDDGNACNGIEACDAAGNCLAATAPLVDDHNPCTDDWCDPETGVHNEPVEVGTSCDLGTCQGTGTCSADVLCERTTLPHAPDTDPCTLEFCDETTGQLDVVQCSETNPNILTTAAQSMRFLYEGPDAVQSGVAPGTFEDTTAAVVRGRVLWEDGLGVPNVRVEVLGATKFGWTRTQVNGDFVMVVPSGREVTLDLSRPGYPRIKRAFTAQAREQIAIEDVVLVQRDQKTTQILMGSSEGQLASASTRSDQDGQRTVRVYFPPQTTAALVMSDGTSLFTPTLTVRATEYTVGERGPERMPATLPPASAYTFATELTADEAIAAGTDTIQFDRTVYLYTENFLGFEPGTPIPVGFVNYETGKWVASKNGAVFEVTDVVGGVAAVTGLEDLPSAEQPDADELRAIAQAYSIGSQVWRSPLNHFSAWDCNQGFGPPDDAVSPPAGGGSDGEGEGGDAQCGSRIDTGDGAVVQDFPLLGTTQQLHHSSRRAKTHFPLEIPVTPSVVSPSLRRVEVTVAIAGREFQYGFSPEANQTFTFSWDGKDAMGRVLQGRALARVTARNIYDVVYTVPERFGYSGNGTSITNVPGREQISLDTSWSSWLGRTSVPGIGGLSLSDHHFFDVDSGEVHLGTGEILSDSDLGLIAERIIGTGNSPGIFPVVGAPATEVGIALPRGSSSSFAVDEGRVHVLQHVGGVVREIRWVTYNVSAEPVVEYVSDDLVESGFSYPALPVILPGGRKIFADYSGVATRLSGRIRELLPDGTTRTLVDTLPIKIWSMAATPDGQGMYVNLAPEVNTLSGKTVLYVDLGSVDCSTGQCSGAVITEVLGGDPSPSVPVVVGCPVELGQRGIPRGYMGLATGPDGTLYFSLAGEDLTLDYLCAMSPDGVVTELAHEGGMSLVSYGPQGLAVMGGQRHQVAHDPPVLRLLEVDGSLRPVAFSASGSSVSPSAALTARVAISGTSGQYTDLYGMQAGTKPSDFYAAGRLDLWRVHSGLPTFGDALLVSSKGGNERYLFSPDGRHLETRNGRTGSLLRSFNYDSAFNLTALRRHGLGEAVVEEIAVERDGAGVPTGVSVDPDGEGPALARSHLIELDDQGALQTLIDPAGATYSVGHDAPEPQLITTMVDPAGRQKTYAYDAKARVVTQTDPLVSNQANPGAFQYSYTDSSPDLLRATKVTTPSGRTTIFGRELRGSEEQKVNVYPDGSELTFERDAANTTTEVARDGTRTVETLQPDTTAPPHDYATATRVTLPESGVSLFRTQQKSRTLSSEGWLETTTHSECLEASGEELCSTTEQDSATGTRTTTSPAGRVTTEMLDAIQRVVQLQGPGSPLVRTVYDGDDVTAIIIDPDGIEASGDERTTQMVYSATTGLLEKVIDPLTHETIFGSYDASDRPGKITLPDAAEVQMTYDIEGNVATVTPPGKAPHGMTYGPRGRIESYSPPVGNTVQFFYDLDRRMDLIDFGPGSQGQSNQVDFAYDPTSGELSSITSPSGVIDVAFENGHMTTLTAPSTNGSIVTSIDYDGFLPTALSWSGPIAGEVQWTYNDRFLIETETIGALPETTVSYQYDADGLVTQAGALAIQRDPTSGRVTTKTIGNIRESFEYNEFAELSRQTVVLLDAMGGVKETLYDVIYDDDGTNGARDALGRITKKTEWIVNGDTPNADGTARALDSRTYDYGYNPEGRPWLESVAVDGNVVSAYDYDENGNRVAVDLSWSQLGYSTDLDVSLSANDTEYNDADQLLTYGTKSYTWNNFGQLSSVYESSTDETTTYEYDLYGNLLSVGLPDGRTIEYDVDGAGRRVGRRELDAQGNEISFRGWIFRDLLRPIAEVDALGNVTARYVYSDGSGARQNGVGQLATRLGANQDTSLPFTGSNVPEAIELLDASGAVTQTLMLSTNQVGSVQLVTDASTGDVVQRIEYDSFGRVLFDSAPGLQPFGFAGGLYDTETDLVRFGARDYEPSVGRWIARDPVRFAGDDNMYAYVAAEPIQFLDPGGLNKCVDAHRRVLFGCGQVSLCIWEPKRCPPAVAECKKALDDLQDNCLGPPTADNDRGSGSDSGFPYGSPHEGSCDQSGSLPT